MKIPLRNNQPPLCVMVSLGLSGLRPGSADRPQDNMIEAADKALYAAKADGRNKLAVAR